MPGLVAVAVSSDAAVLDATMLFDTAVGADGADTAAPAGGGRTTTAEGGAASRHRPVGGGVRSLHGSRR
ncbi:Uncharacterised protein [Mycobacteroides abscessus subsp. abscessus]|nr:Uncharacterised protein [Mycobacteroides abscessus subsp. abscessus]